MCRRSNTLATAMGIAIATVSLCAPLGASAQGIYTYPMAGQGAEQQGKDTAACRQWAMNQTGFDPTRPVPQAAPSYSPAPSGSVNSGVFGRGQYGTGGGVLDAGKGAAGGALFGALAGNAGAGAAIGAVSGLFLGAVKRSSAETERADWEQRQAEQRYEQQQALVAQHANGQRNYASAYKTCMKGRKYEVN